jgi:hypothetical protein
MAGLPDGIFSNQNPQFLYILYGLGKGNDENFCGHSDFLWPLGIFCVHLVYFVAILACCTMKNLATLDIWYENILSGNSVSQMHFCYK